MTHSLGYTLGNVAFVRARRSVFDIKNITLFCLHSRIISDKELIKRWFRMQDNASKGRSQSC